MIDYNNLWYEAWNQSHIRCHFSSFDKLVKYIRKLKQSLDDWTVIVHSTVMHCSWYSLPHRVSCLSFYDAEAGYRNIGIPLLYMFPDDFPIEDVKTEFEFDCDFIVERNYSKNPYDKEELPFE